jgi:WD40 repeat protein
MSAIIPKSLLNVIGTFSPVWLLSLAPKKPRTFFIPNNNNIRCIVPLGGGGNLVAFSFFQSGIVEIWNMATQRHFQTITKIKPQGSEILCMARFTSTELITGSRDHTLKILNLYSGNCVHELQTSSVEYIEVGTRVFVTASNAGNVKVWDKSTYLCLQSIQTNSITCLGLINNSKLVIGSIYSVKTWNLPSEKKTPAMIIPSPLSVSCLTVLNDGRHVITGAQSHAVEKWDVVAGKHCQTFNENSEGRLIWFMEMLFDGKIVVVLENITIQMYDLTSHKCVWTQNIDKGWITALSILPNGDLVATTDQQKVLVWELYK